MKSGCNNISVSLVVATIGRTLELERLLVSMMHQSLQDIELIIVDQNIDDRVERVIARCPATLPCIHARSPRGLSRARNLGIQLASGAIVAFPDDDCWYPNDILSQVKAWFERNQSFDFLCCRAQDETGREVASRWPGRSLVIRRNSVLRACASASLFIRKTALDEIGGFNESMGLGSASPFQSGEDSDLALRCLQQGRKGWFEKQLYVYHPHKAPQAGESARAFGYGMGFGFLLRLHGYSRLVLLYQVMRALGGAVISLLQIEPGRALFYWKSAVGRFAGYQGKEAWYQLVSERVSRTG